MSCDVNSVPVDSPCGEHQLPPMAHFFLHMSKKISFDLYAFLSRVAVSVSSSWLGETNHFWKIASDPPKYIKMKTTTEIILGYHENFKYFFLSPDSYKRTKKLYGSKKNVKLQSWRIGAVTENASSFTCASESHNHMSSSEPFLFFFFNHGKEYFKIGIHWGFGIGCVTLLYFECSWLVPMEMFVILSYMKGREQKRNLQNEVSFHCWRMI